MKTQSQIQIRRIDQSATLKAKSWLALAAANLLLLSVSHANAQTYAIDWFTVDGGGGTSTGSVYQISGTIGQPDAGNTMSGGVYNLDGGFWGISAVVQMPGAPILTMRRTSPTTAIISWPYPSTGFVLQETSNLAGPTWIAHVGTLSNDGVNNYIEVNTSMGNRFFRLKKAVTTIQPTKSDTMYQ